MAMIKIGPIVQILHSYTYLAIGSRCWLQGAEKSWFNIGSVLCHQLSEELGYQPAVPQCQELTH